jgi:hypothetical protein
MPCKGIFTMGFLRDWSLKRRFGGSASNVPSRSSNAFPQSYLVEQYPNFFKHISGAYRYNDVAAFGVGGHMLFDILKRG